MILTGFDGLDAISGNLQEKWKSLLYAKLAYLVRRDE